MAEIDVVKICEKVLERFSKIGYERTGGIATEQLIFPNKFPSKKKEKKILEKTNDKPEKAQEILEKELLKYVRISEQELRQLFIEEFIKEHSKATNKLYYSIETPTQEKYSFSKVNKKADDKISDIIKINENGQSALLDMCVFKKENCMYIRDLNIEFKHQNAALKNLTKDVLKLMYEKQNGAFVFLLKNTNTGTLRNTSETGLLNKLYISFSMFNDKDYWRGDEKKHIQLIILSLEQKTKNNGMPFLMHRTITKNNFDSFFSFNKAILKKESSLEMEPLNYELVMVAEDNAKYEKS